MKTQHKYIQSLLSILLGAALCSCAPEIKEKPGRLGIEASPQDFQKAVDSALSGISLLNANKGSSVYYEDNQRIEMGAILLNSVTKNALTDIKESTTSYKFVFYQDWYKYKTSGAIEDEKHSEIPIEFAKAPSPAMPLNLSDTYSNLSASRLRTLATTDECDGIDQKDQFGRSFDCTKIFNLVYELRLVDPPDLVKQKPNCMNLPNCKMTVRYLSFDNVEWKNGLSVATFSERYEISADIPDIMYKISSTGETLHDIPALSHCTRFVYPTTTSSYLVTLCKVLRDFSN